MLRNDIFKRVAKLEIYSDGLIIVKMSSKPVDIVMFMPKTDHNDEKIEEITRSVTHCIRREEIN